MWKEELSHSIMVTSMILCPIQIQRFSITMQIKGCKAGGDKTCYFQSNRQRFFTTNLSVCLVYFLTTFKSNLEVALWKTISFCCQFTGISNCLEKGILEPLSGNVYRPAIYYFINGGNIISSFNKKHLCIVFSLRLTLTCNLICCPTGAIIIQSYSKLSVNRKVCLAH